MERKAIFPLAIALTALLVLFSFPLALILVAIPAVIASYCYETRK